MNASISVSEDSFRLKKPFTISRGTRVAATVVTATEERDGVVGRGECVPYARYGESVESVRAEIEGLDPGIDRRELQSALPPGAARNAVDCALWDLEAKASGTSAWALAGLPAPDPVLSAFTLSLDTPEAMEHEARSEAARPLLKVKLGGEGDLTRIEAVRRGSPDARIIVDAN